LNSKPASVHQTGLKPAKQQFIIHQNSKSQQDLALKEEKSQEFSDHYYKGNKKNNEEK
jgi:hypothetical protein